MSIKPSALCQKTIKNCPELACRDFFKNCSSWKCASGTFGVSMVYGVHFLFLSPRMQIKFPKFKLSKKCTLKKSMKYNTKNNIAEKKNESCEVITFTLNSCLLLCLTKGWASLFRWGLVGMFCEFCTVCSQNYYESFLTLDFIRFLLYFKVFFFNTFIFPTIGLNWLSLH